ncbi:hypothetical protein [Mycobacterium sp. ACS1612]|uniref:hypothetical protein n=1 Tax=Mycobacterium sp. ACS1612 TaxID=1834117 RepID=UPI000ABCFE04|nr:hypothetical protein [Mycobacterium sp. ACS1612]
MKRTLIAAAASAIGGLGAVGLMSAAPAQADCSDPSDPGFTFPLTPARVVCVANEQAGTFAMTVSPAYNIDRFLNGNPTEGGGRDGLGILDQPQTFVNSIADFLNGPRSPE